MKNILIAILMSVSFMANAFMEEGEKITSTVTGVEMTQRISDKTGIDTDTTTAILEETGKRVGYHLAYQNELMAGGFYFSNNGEDNDCDGVDDDCDSPTLDYKKSNLSSQLGNSSDRMLRHYYRDTMSKTFNEASKKMAGHNTTRSNRSTISAVATNVIEQTDQEVPIEKAAQNDDLKRKFQDKAIALFKENRGKLKDGEAEILSKIMKDLLDEMRSADKKHKRTRRRVEVLKSNRSFNRTDEIYPLVSELTGASTEQIRSTIDTALGLIRLEVEQGNTVRVEGLGTFNTGGKTKDGDTIFQYKKLENRDGVKLNMEDLDVSIGTPIVWTPSTSAQIERNKANGRGVCQFGKCYCSVVAENESDPTDSPEVARAKEKANKTKCSNQRRMAETSTVLEEASRIVSDGLGSFYEKDNKAAGTRVRKTMQDLKVLAQDIRTEVQNKKNN